ncbi:hypothetical protein NDU88_001877 [Pleurodeles waltl]|uniref:Uncharacterized protein n=1 Tax=Pleurodeles waltl TaxID=8319 RepID=A0AAV7KT28_PLEWA|nr:hypothetical protein NDU88_001877 [Pleurodeles waltl]
MVPVVVPLHRAPTGTLLTWSPLDAGRGGHHQPPPLLLRLRSGVLSSLRSSGAPPSSSRGPASDDRCSPRPSLQGRARRATTTRAPGWYSGLQGAMVPPRHSRSRQSRSTLRRTPPLPLRGVAQVCCAGGSRAGLSLNGEMNGPVRAHGLCIRHLGSRSHTPLTHYIDDVMIQGETEEQLQIQLQSKGGD